MRHAMLLASVLLIIGLAAAPDARRQPVREPAPSRQAATSPAPVVLWPEGVPGAIKNGGPEVEAEGRVSNVHEPSLVPFPAPAGRRSGTAVIICPGGAYNRLAVEKEGLVTARWLNSLGVSAFVLKYRLKEYGHPAPLRDVLRAVRLLRSGADRWGISRDRIGVLGFSAGGHLAASAGTLFDAPEGRTGADLDRVSARPDFLVLVYPVILLKGPYSSASSRKGLLGDAPPPELVDMLSLDSRVTKDTPPAFLVHGGTDSSVPPENSALFYMALRQSGVSAELHLYREGAHGIGLEPNHGPMSDWPGRCAEWLLARELLQDRFQDLRPAAASQHENGF